MSPSPTATLAPARTIRILVVDDDSLVRFVHLGFLRSAERNVGPGIAFECDEAPSVHAAIRAIDRDAPDLVLLDHSLGDGYGVDVLRHIRAGNLDSRVVIVSGSDESQIREQAERLGIAAWIRKPMTLRQLTSVISAVLD